MRPFWFFYHSKTEQWRPFCSDFEWLLVQSVSSKKIFFFFFFFINDLGLSRFGFRMVKSSVFEWFGRFENRTLKRSVIEWIRNSNVRNSSPDCTHSLPFQRQIYKLDKEGLATLLELVNIKIFFHSDFKMFKNQFWLFLLGSYAVRSYLHSFP